jgi:transaldolase
MNRIKRSISAIILAAFLLNTTISDPAFAQALSATRHIDKLAAASVFTETVGIERKDMAMIKLALDGRLIEVERKGLPLELGTFRDVLKRKILRKDIMTSPANIQILFNKTELTPHGFSVECKIKDRYGVRIYYALFSVTKDAKGCFPVNVYAAKDRSLMFGKGFSHLDASDETAIERYIQHERGVDAVIKYAHENGIAVSSDAVHFDYADTVKKIIKDLKIEITDAPGLKPIGSRECIFIPMTGEIERMLRQGRMTLEAANKTSQEVIPAAHSSNSAIHIFINEKDLAELKRAGGNGKLAKARLNDHVVHEMGVMLGLPILKFINGRPRNEIDNRQVIVRASGRNDQLEPKRYTTANLDTNLDTRDYAAANTGFSDKGEMVIAGLIRSFSAPQLEQLRDIYINPDAFDAERQRVVANSSLYRGSLYATQVELILHLNDMLREMGVLYEIATDGTLRNCPDVNTIGGIGVFAEALLRKEYRSSGNRSENDSVPVSEQRPDTDSRFGPRVHNYLDGHPDAEELGQGPYAQPQQPTADKAPAGEDKFKGIDFRLAEGVIPLHLDKIKKELASFLQFINELPAGSSLTMENFDPYVAFFLSRDEARAGRERDIWHKLANQAFLNNGWSYIRHSNKYIKRKSGQTDDELRLELIGNFLNMNHPDEVRLKNLIRDFNINDRNVHIVPDVLRGEGYVYVKGTGDLYRRMTKAAETKVEVPFADARGISVEVKEAPESKLQIDISIGGTRLPSILIYNADELAKALKDAAEKFDIKGLMIDAQTPQDIYLRRYFQKEKITESGNFSFSDRSSHNLEYLADLLKRVLCPVSPQPARSGRTQPGSKPLASSRLESSAGKSPAEGIDPGTFAFEPADNAADGVHPVEVLLANGTNVSTKEAIEAAINVAAVIKRLKDDTLGKRVPDGSYIFTELCMLGRPKPLSASQDDDLDPEMTARLRELGLVGRNGKMSSVTKNVILSMVYGNPDGIWTDDSPFTREGSKALKDEVATRAELLTLGTKHIMYSKACSPSLADAVRWIWTHPKIRSLDPVIAIEAFHKIVTITVSDTRNKIELIIRFEEKEYPEDRSGEGLKVEIKWKEPGNSNSWKGSASTSYGVLLSFTKRVFEQASSDMKLCNYWPFNRRRGVDDAADATPAAAPADSPLLKFQEIGQQIWLDGLTWEMIKSGKFEELVSVHNITGVTTNPTLIKAYLNDKEVMAKIAKLAAQGRTREEIYFEVIRELALAVIGVFNKCGVEGKFSVELSPDKADDVDASVAEARMWTDIDPDHMMVKVAATKAGYRIIEKVTAIGRNVNATLIFTEDQYARVARAYIAGLEKADKAGHDLKNIYSVASFFVSRWDVELAQTLPEQLQGKIANAVTTAAYNRKFETIFSSARFSMLAAKGARVQDYLVASTGSKGADMLKKGIIPEGYVKYYPPLIYVEPIEGKNVVNTLPLGTIETMIKDGVKVAPTIKDNSDMASSDLKEAGKLVNLSEVGKKLFEAGMKSFLADFATIMKTIDDAIANAKKSEATEQNLIRMIVFSRVLIDNPKGFTEEQYYWLRREWALRLGLPVIIGNPTEEILAQLKRHELDLLVGRDILAVTDQTGPARRYILTPAGERLAQDINRPASGQSGTAKNASNGPTDRMGDTGTGMFGPKIHEYLDGHPDAEELGQGPYARRQQPAADKAPAGAFTLDTDTLKNVAMNFRDDVNSRGTNSSSLSDIVTEVGTPTGQEKGDYMFIDLGGTNLRVGLVRFKGDGVIEKREEDEWAAAVPIARVTGGGITLFKYIANRVKEFIEARNLSGDIKIGFTFSFPMRKEGVARGFVTPECNVKGYNFDKVMGEEVAKLLTDALRAIGMPNVKVIALVNDTEGVRDTGAYMNPNTIAGGVFGTGHNSAVRDSEGRSVNLESGAFDKLESDKALSEVRAFDDHVDKLSSNPGVHPLEKRLSGKYVGPLFGLVIESRVRAGKLFAGHKGELPVIFTDHQYEIDGYLGFSGKHLTDIEKAWLEDGADSVRKYFEALGVNGLTDEDAEGARNIERDIMGRSAQLGAATFAGIVMSREGTETPKGEYAYAIDGSLLKYPEYINMMKAALADIFGKEYASKLEVFEAPDGAGIGAALTAMTVDTQSGADNMLTAQLPRGDSIDMDLVRTTILLARAHVAEDLDKIRINRRLLDRLFALADAKDLKKAGKYIEDNAGGFLDEQLALIRGQLLRMVYSEIGEAVKGRGITPVDQFEIVHSALVNNGCDALAGILEGLRALVRERDKDKIVTAVNLAVKTSIERLILRRAFLTDGEGAGQRVEGIDVTSQIIAGRLIKALDSPHVKGAMNAIALSHLWQSENFKIGEFVLACDQVENEHPGIELASAKKEPVASMQMLQKEGITTAEGSGRGAVYTIRDNDRMLMLVTQLRRLVIASKSGFAKAMNSGKWKAYDEKFPEWESENVESLLADIDNPRVLESAIPVFLGVCAMDPETSLEVQGRVIHFDWDIRDITDLIRARIVDLEGVVRPMPAAEPAAESAVDEQGSPDIEPISVLSRIMRLVPTDWLDGFLTIDKVAQAVKGAGFQPDIFPDEKTVLIFSQKATFGEKKPDGSFEEGLGPLLPSFIKSNIQVAVIAKTEAQRAFIEELNRKLEEENVDGRIVCEDSVALARSAIPNGRYYYLKVASEEDPGLRGVTSITIIVQKILDAIGEILGIPEQKLRNAHEAQRRFAEAV